MKMVAGLPLVAALLGATAVHAADGRTLIYICVEERSVGWEKQDNGETVVGKFKPTDDKFFVRFRSHKWEVIGTGRFLLLSQIEVVEQGKTYTYQSTACDEDARGSYAREDYNSRSTSCESLLEANSTYFGTESMTYGFFPSLSKAPKSTTYIETNLFGVPFAFLKGGSCILVD